MGFRTSGGREIDAARHDVAASPTSAENYERRALLLYLWIGALQQQGADTRGFFATDAEFHELQNKLDSSGLSDDEINEIQTRQCSLIDQAYPEIEQIQRQVDEGHLIARPSESDASAPVGDMDADWPEFQGNNRHTGYTTAPGPGIGRTAWKHPVGLGWYSRPVVEANRVYLSSPGMNTTCFCLDVESGEEIWRSTQHHPIFGIYKYPAIASTPVVLSKTVILRETNSHGGNEGQARNLVYLSRETGESLSRRYAGHIDYRTQYAPVVADEQYAVYPFGKHDIYDTPPVCQNLNRLICADRDNETIYWDVNIGDIDALAEPVLSDGIAVCGTMEGYLYGLRMGPVEGATPVMWSYHAHGALNTAVTLADGRVYFGCNGGYLYCLDLETGEEIWSQDGGSINPAARKYFSTPTVAGSRLYVGDADGTLRCLEADTGSRIWRIELTDWVRARPVVSTDGILAATIDGNLHRVSPDGSLLWSRRVSTHPIYADLAQAIDQDGGANTVVLTDSNLTTRCVSNDGSVIWAKSLLDEIDTDDEQRVFADQLSGGTYYQSKPTAYRGAVYFGTPAGFLFAVDAASGEELWRYEMGAAISVGPACSNGRVFSGQQGGERFFYCHSASDGKLLWKQTLPGGWVWGSATVNDGRVYVPTVSGYAVCLDEETGHIIWMYPTAQSVPAEPAVAGDLVYFGSWSRSLYAFNKATGEIVWKQMGISLDSGTLIAEGGRVYTPHHANVFSSFDAATGALVSSGNHNDGQKGNHSDFNATPAFHDGRAIFTARGGIGLRGVPLFSTVYCVDTETADIKWTFPDGGGLSAPAIAAGRVYIASGNSPFLYCLDEGTGEPVWVHRLGHRTEESTLCIYRDRVYVLCADGYVHSIE